MYAIITMAGASRRFRIAGYTMPKYEIEVRGRTLFAWSMTSLARFAEAGWRFVFVAQREAGAGAFIEREAGRLGLGGFSLIELDAITDGQATTALAAAPAIAEPGAPVLVYNIDTHVDPQGLDPAAVRGAGWIPCFPGEGDGWSFARADEDGRVAELREKQRISPHATIGLYHFGSFDLYRDTYEAFFRDPANMERGERYIAPMYNHLIARGEAVFLHEVPARCVHPLGTPAEVERFALG